MQSFDAARFPQIKPFIDGDAMDFEELGQLRNGVSLM
jgi:hypothetical protein